MAASELKDIVRRFSVEVWNKGNMDMLGDVLAANYVYHDPDAPDIHTLDDYRQFISNIRTHFPDARYAIEDIIAEGDRVMVRYTFSGTHREGHVYGVPPSGKKVEHAGVAIYRFEAWKVLEVWDIWDAAGVMRRLGAIPTTD